MLNAAARQRIYLILTFVMPVLVFYGVLGDDEVGMWLALAAAVLGAGGTVLAAANTPTGRHRRDG
ncbi:MAG: hypothetical protein QM658_09685 [Gordonia sp. (in: high G+C Gram-positive bacteria)]